MMFIPEHNVFIIRSHLNIYKVSNFRFTAKPRFEPETEMSKMIRILIFRKEALKTIRILEELHEKT